LLVDFRPPLTGRAAPSQVRMFVDFDGTIALEDTTDVILERFALPAWRVIEADWVAGLIGSRECLARQVDLVRARPDELDDVAREIPLDPHFLDFSALCRMNAIPLTVVSDGFGQVIAAMLAGAGADVPVLANRLAWLGEDRWRLDFPHANDLCRSAAGHCKCRALDREPGTLRILVGDGRSDFCAAESADLVFAKGALAEHCQGNGLAYQVFGNFAGAIALLTEWIGALADAKEAPKRGEPLHASPSA
jgi:2-hydroxy-3-keto-5-methylthiopentenyl-1-phosphate phosphatase